MNWVKVFQHDVYGGLLRRRYLIVPVMFALPCVLAGKHMAAAGLVGTWMDYLMYCFKGILPLTEGANGFEFPILWFLVMGGCMYIALDYPLNDLTEAGQQVIVRSRSRKGWFLSKCAWNLLSSLLYVLLGVLTALVFALISGGRASLVNTPEVSEKLLQIYIMEPVAPAQAVLVAVVLPYLTLAAFTMAQMALCLIMKPVFSFLLCVCVMIMSLFISSPYLPGNGAVVVRNGILVEEFLDPTAMALTCLAVIGGSIIIGLIRFNHMDLLRYEG